jgi:hypothetical protein
LVASIAAPRGDHRQDEETARAEQFLIWVDVAFADLLWNVSEVELDRPMANRLEVDEQRPTPRVEEVSRVWLSVQ